MAEPKAKTLQQKLGFFDEDLKSPVHDDIMKWLDLNILTFTHSVLRLKEWRKEKVEELKKLSSDIYQKNISENELEIKNLQNLIKQNKLNLAENEEKCKKAKVLEIKEKLSYSETSEYIESNIDRYKKNIDEDFNSLQIIEERLSKLKQWKGLGEIPKRNEIVIIEKPWEFPITSRSTNSSSGYVSGKNIIGFLDLKVTFSYTKLSVLGIDFSTQKITSEVKWTQTNEDINFKNGDSKGKLVYTFFVEVKTKIPSLGELFRQLRMYKEYINNEIIVVCPDGTEKKLIESQGFRFYKYTQ